MSEILKGLAEEKTRDRGRWWILGVVAVTALVGSVALVLFYDDPLADDAWMLPSLTKVAEEDNGLARFCREMDTKPLIGKMPFRVMSIDASNEAEIRDFLKANVELRSAVDRLLAIDQALWRWPVEWENLTWSMSLPGINKIAEVMGFMRLEAIILVHEGRLDEAMKISRELAQLGSGLHRAEGTMMHWRIGVWAKTLSLEVMEMVAKSPKVGPAILSRMKDEVQIEWVETSRSLAFAFRVEYRLGKEMEDNDEETLRDLDNDEQRFVVKWLLKENRTANWFLDWQRPLIAALASGKESEVAKARTNLKNRLDVIEVDRWKTSYNANAGGYVMLLKSFSSFDDVHNRSIILLARERLFRTMVSLRLYELENAELPPTLQALPIEADEENTDSIDPFNGASLRWDEKKRVLYSVSHNGQDDGGSVGDNPDIMMPDYGSLYWWDEKSK